MDLSQLSDADFQALQTNRLDQMSDAGFGALVKAQQSAKSMPEKVAQAQQASAERYNPTNDMTAGDLIKTGAGKSVDDLLTGVSQLGKQIAGRDLTAGRAQVDEKNRLDAPLMATPAGKIGNFGGNAGIAMLTAPIPGVNSVSGGALVGAGLGALQPVGSNDNRMNNAIAGAVGGAGANALARGVSRVLSPQPMQGVNSLMGNDIGLTVGQRMGGGWKRAEDALASVPVLGDQIKNAQRRSFTDFNGAVSNMALNPIGEKLPQGLSGRDAVSYVEKAIGKKYDNALQNIQRVSGDSQFGSEIMNLQTMVHNSPLPQEVQGQFDSIIKNQIAGKFQGRNTMTAQTYKDAESELGRLAAKYQADPSADKQLLGDAVEEAQASLRRLLERADPAHADEVKAANAAWMNFKRMQRASTSLGAEDGVFTPEQFLNSVKAMDRSKDKAQFARGNAPGQQLAEDAKRVMGSKVPDSGTPFRTLVSNPIQGGVSVLTTSPLMAPFVGPYSKTGQAMYNALLSDKRPAVSRIAGDQLNALSGYLGAAGAGGALTYGR